MDEIRIITKGGIILCKKNYSPLRGEPINQMIKEYILADRTWENKAIIGNYLLRWLTDNETSTIIICCHSKTIKIDYVENYLQEVMAEFKSIYLPDKTIKNKTEIEEMLERIYKSCQQRAKEAKDNKLMRSYEETEKGMEKMMKLKISNDDKKKKNEENVIVSEKKETFVFDGMKKK